MLTVERLEMDYGKFRMNVDDLRFKNGFHVVLGSNGSGKSSFMRGIIGYGGHSIIRRDIHVDGERISKTNEIISYLPQTNPSYRIGVEEYIGLTARKKAPLFKSKMIERFSLENLLEHSIEDLSGGEFKRVQCAQISMEQKPIIMLDEAEQGLDMKYQHQIMKWMKEESMDKPVIASMHDAALAMAYADSVTMIKNGEMAVKTLPVEDITSEMLSDCYDIPLMIERKNNAFAIYHRQL